MKPTVQFIVNFYFASDNAWSSMAFSKSPNFDPAYLQQQCDKVYEQVSFEFGKTKAYFNQSEKEELARRVKSAYVA